MVNTSLISPKIYDATERMAGWCSFEKAINMAYYILRERPKVLVEIGVFGGRSLVPMGIAAKFNNNFAKVYGVDPWSKEACFEGVNSRENDQWWGSLDMEEIHKSCKEFVAHYGLQETIKLLRLTSSAAANRLKDETVDFLHIDGNHSEEKSCEDLSLWLPKVPFGGIIVFDDINWSTTNRAYSQLLARASLLNVIRGSCAILQKRG